jgi:hypothetical protein
MDAHSHGIAGYDYGSDQLPTSPVSLEELRRIEETVEFTNEDLRYLKLAGEVLRDQAENMVDLWRRKMSSQDHLARYFHAPDGKSDERYKAAVKPRFMQWVIDTCSRAYDQKWLDYQEEIARRHTPDKKNVVDGVQTPSVVHLRYLIAFTSVLITTARDFLTKKGHSREQVEKMQLAWTKAMFITLSLWSRPYTKDGLW